MSVNININKMNFNGRSYAERAEAEKRKINRILSVREQSNELAQKVLKKTRCAREQELKKIQQIKEKELGEWKKKTQCQIQNEIDNCIGNFGNAHIAAVDASCEEDESLKERRDEQDLMAAMRGRVAMLQVQREREREIEKKLLKKKRMQQKTIGIQADSLAQQRFRENLISSGKSHAEAEISDEDESNEIYSTKPNFHKHSEPYNPQNYTSHSVDSSNNCDDSDNGDIIELESDESKEHDESEVEFNQITNLLKQGLHKTSNNDSPEEIEVQSSDSESLMLPYKIESPKKVTIRSPTKKKNGILKKSPAKTTTKNKSLKTKKQSSPVKNVARKEKSVDNRVTYIDYGNKYETTYVPDKNLVVRNEKSNAKSALENAQIQTDDDLITRKINDDILKQLTELRSKEALEKEKIRRDYEKLRFELDELSKQEQEVKAKTNVYKNLSRDQLLRKEEIRQRKMNEAAESAMKKNIITCPPVAQNEKSSRQKSNEINVAAPNNDQSDNTSAPNLKRSNSEINNLVKIEKLKDLLEKINHQKRLLLNEIEKSDDIPGPDLEKVMDCIKKLEEEKAALNPGEKIDESKLKKMNELIEREKKIEEREIRLENKLRELFKQQNEKILKSSSSSSSEPTPSDGSSTTSAENTKKIVQPPVEIIIKVQQPKSPHKKSRKSYRCIDTLNRQPGKVYPKTPLKKKKSVETDTEEVNKPEMEKSQRETQTSPIPFDGPKPILKNSQMKQISIAPKQQKTKENIPKASSSAAIVKISSQQKQPADSEDYSQSTVYRELPSQINLVEKESQKAKKKLNPLLMDYITRVLHMNKNVGAQLNVDVSSITTPGSSTINTSENISISTGEVNFDQDRMNRLQKFIDDNHSLINETDESLEKVEVQKKQNEEMEKVVKGLWRDILHQKKSSQATKSSHSQQKHNNYPSSKAPSVQSSKKVNQPHIPQEQPKKTRSQTEPENSAGSKIQQRPKITQQDMTNVTKYIESQMLNNYSEYTANCQRRIAELTQMMEKVRQEKLKLIENSMSSNEFNNFTEYKELAQTTNLQSGVNPSVTGSSDPKESPSHKDDPPSEEINNILQFQTRPFGVSKDSGISISRPVTSSDYRESPDVRLTSEENNNNNLFQPILKDIPKVPRMKITPVDGETQTLKDISFIIKQQQEEMKMQKKQKPPLSLKSPQFEKQQHEPHELSTIAEIETPTASKVLIQEEPSGVGNLHSFPNFEEYAKGSNLGESKHTESSFLNLNDLKKALPDMNVNTFLEQEHVSLMDISKDENDENKEVLSNASSLMNIEEELRRRNLLDGCFQINYNEENMDNDVQACFEKDDKTTPTATKQIQMEPISPKRKPPQSRIVIKTPEKVNKIEQIAKTPTKKKHQESLDGKLPEAQSPNSCDTLSGIQEIEKDFQATQGLGWAASTLKRTEESKKKEDNSSSSSGKPDNSIRIDICLENSSSSSDGQPLNLKDFLRRELLSRSKNDKYLSDDSSLSSRFMKSLLKSSENTSSSSSSNDPRSESSQNAKLRTSTPVRMSSENLVRTGASSQIFVGAESVSSVKDSSDSSKDKSKSL